LAVSNLISHPRNKALLSNLLKSALPEQWLNVCWVVVETFDAMPLIVRVLGNFECLSAISRASFYFAPFLQAHTRALWCTLSLSSSHAVDIS
jgi:hypothetical protein